MVAVALLDEHEDVVDVDLHLAHELHLEDEVLGDGLLLGALAVAHLVAHGEVLALVVLKLAGARGVVVLEGVEAREDVAHAQHRREGVHKVALLLVGHKDVGAVERVVQADVGELLGVLLEVLVVGLEDDDAARLGVSEQADRLVDPLGEVAEAHDVAERLDGVEDAVRAGERLDEAVHLQVLVDPQGVERLGVEAGEEHVDDDEHIEALRRGQRLAVHILALQAARHVLVVAVEALRVG